MKLDTRHKKSDFSYILCLSSLLTMKILLIIYFTLTIILITTFVVLAQPGLPSTPDQAPIDGGLGLLAAAGGAYAWKKLRGKNEDGTM